MLNYLVKVRNQFKFLAISIPKYVMASEHFNFVEYTNKIIIKNGLSLDNTIIYEYSDDNTISCLGIDDGYEWLHNYGKVVLDET